MILYIDRNMHHNFGDGKIGGRKYMLESMTYNKNPVEDK